MKAPGRSEYVFCALLLVGLTSCDTLFSTGITVPAPCRNHIPATILTEEERTCAISLFKEFLSSNGFAFEEDRQSPDALLRITTKKSIRPRGLTVNLVADHGRITITVFYFMGARIKAPREYNRVAEELVTLYKRRFGEDRVLISSQ